MAVTAVSVSVGFNLPRASLWVGKPSGWLPPLAARTLATAPWVLSTVPWALPVGRALPGLGVILIPVGIQDKIKGRGSTGATRSPVGVGSPQRSQASGHRWCVAATRAFTPGDASSLLRWAPPERPLD